MDKFLENTEIETSLKINTDAVFNFPITLAIGMFDGVHLGHQSVINSAIHEATVWNGLAGALTFEPHPSVVLRPENPTKMIYSLDQKRSLLFKEGLDFVVWKSFNLSFAQISAASFLPKLKAAFPKLKSIHVGSNFKFGQNRKGDVDLLAKDGQHLGVNVFSCDRIQMNGIAVSSSLIRDKLQKGQIEHVNGLLGRNFTAVGKVVSGNKLGTKLGFPTINLDWNPDLVPKFGVYAVRFHLDDTNATPLKGVANFGIRPTVTNNARPVLEVHSLDPISAPLDTPVSVQMLSMIRPEVKFDSVDQLVAQITKDKENAVRYLSNSK